MRATVKDVAARAGVSPKTVSNVITGRVVVSPATRERVERAVAELDYVPNLSARGLRNGRTGVIAVALPDLGTAYSAELAHHLVEVAHEAGYSIQIEETGSRPDRERDLMSRAREHLVDGLILNPVLLSQSAITRAESLPPVVVIGEVEQEVADRVVVDSIGAAYDMTRFLLGTGARRIAAVGTATREESAAGDLRRIGYRRAMEEAGEAPIEIDRTGWTSASGAEAVDTWLADGNPLPDALFCFTDGLAFGALRALADHGVRVPEDVQVAGFDDVDQSRFSIPTLTTVHFDIRAYAEAAVGQLVRRIEEREGPPVNLVIPHRIVVRDSTRSPAVS
jgi:LacI family repressor for deo operon, udp, cdd, tsx, nupC, and nupG